MNLDFKLTNYFHVIGKTEFHGWPIESMEKMWGNMCNFLEDFKEDGLRTHAFVLMGNYFHLLCSTEQNSLKLDLEWMNELINISMIDVACDYGNIIDNYTVVPIKSFKQYKEAYRYVYRNPVEAGLVSKAEDYEYSSLLALLHGRAERVSFEDNMNLSFNPLGLLRWINKEFQFENHLFH